MTFIYYIIPIFIRNKSTFERNNRNLPEIYNNIYVWFGIRYYDINMGKHNIILYRMPRTE